MKNLMGLSSDKIDLASWQVAAAAAAVVVAAAAVVVVVAVVAFSMSFHQIALDV